MPLNKETKPNQEAENNNDKVACLNCKSNLIKNFNNM